MGAKVEKIVSAGREIAPISEKFTAAVNGMIRLKYNPKPPMIKPIPMADGNVMTKIGRMITGTVNQMPVSAMVHRIVNMVVKMPIIDPTQTRMRSKLVKLGELI